MAYTSDQYKYLLFRRLQRHFSMADPIERCYTQNFFGKLFDDSITVTEESYNNFINAMDTEIQYCFDNNIDQASDITEAMIQSEQHLLIEAFAAIGITLVIELAKTSGFTVGGDATFTKPNGEIMVYSVRENQNEFDINIAARTEYNYAKLSASYYNFEIGEIYNEDDYNPMSAGIRTYWSYNSDTSTMTITGDGTFINAPTDVQIGSGDYTTLILGANVSHIITDALKRPSVTNLVLLHATDVDLILDRNIAGTSVTGWTLNVYCNNEVFRNYEGFPTGLTINWHTLDEWNPIS